MVLVGTKLGKIAIFIVKFIHVALQFDRYQLLFFLMSFYPGSVS